MQTALQIYSELKEKAIEYALRTDRFQIGSEQWWLHEGMRRAYQDAVTIALKDLSAC